MYLFKKLPYVVFIALIISGSDAETASYRYDDLNRLVGIEYDDGSRLSYTYDEVGNRTLKTSLNLDCPACSGDVVELRNSRFVSGTHCECDASTSITLSDGVVVESGASVLIRSPRINFQKGFQADTGSALTTIPQ